MRRLKPGRKLPGRLNTIVSLTGVSVSDLALKVAENSPFTSQKDINDMVNREFLRENAIRYLRRILQSEYTPRKNSIYRQVIEENWKLPVEEIQRYYQEDKPKGKLSREEISAFGYYYKPKVGLKTLL